MTLRTYEWMVATHVAEPTPQEISQELAAAATAP
jgi:hypothetical protein